jgi:hypothetical protein
MPTKNLPSVGALLRDSWNFFIASWNDSVKVTVWFLYIGLVDFALLLLEKISPYFNIIIIPAQLGVVVLSLWATIRTIQTVFDLEAGKKLDVGKKISIDAWKLILPMLWISILDMLVVLGAIFICTLPAMFLAGFFHLNTLITVGIFIILTIPGVYLAITMSFSSFLLVDGHQRGTAALSASRSLFKGRFWATLWRLFAGSAVFGIALMIGVTILFAILILIAGPSHFSAMNATSKLDPLAQGTIDLLQSIIQAAVLPLFLGFQVKVYRALKR